MQTMQSITGFLSELLAGQTLSAWQCVVAFFIAYLGGILASLTPCVYPMIPITLGVVGGMGPARKSWKDTMIGGLTYVSGMILVYSFLGVIAGMTGRVFGSLTSTSGWYLFLGIIMSIAAVMMLEVIPFDPLSWWEILKQAVQNKKKGGHAIPHHTKIQKEMTLLGVFALGASSGLIAAPCTTPILTSILAFIANKQSVFLGFALMFAFSLGLGTILLGITAFAGFIQILPRSGQWLKTVKTLSGLILLAFAEYLIYRAGGFGG